jgi:hypothetical protein
MYKAFIDTIKQNNFRGFNTLEYSSPTSESGGQELYISFKTILRFTAENLNLFTGTETSKTEIIKIDWESDKPMFLFSTSISCNLQKCYIRNSLLKTSIGTLYSPNTEDTGSIAPFSEIDYFRTPQIAELKESMVITAPADTTSPRIYPSIGNINNIYINAGYLLKILIRETDNEDGKVSLRKYLQELCNGVNKALGSINDLQVIIDEDASTPVLTIVDYQQKRIKGLSGLLTKDRPVTTLKGQGLGSMLTNISAQSSITPDVATMISVGAQLQGSALGEEAVSFSRLSKGLIDRVSPQKFITLADLDQAAKNAAESEAKAKDRFQAVMNTYAQLVEYQRPSTAYGPIKLTADLQTDYESIATDFYKYLLAKFTETGQTATAFIPIKLSFNMRGISGMKIYQKFRLTDDILPMSYNSNYEFIAMGISHTIDNSKWDTAVSATISLIDPPVSEVLKFSIPLEVVELPGSTTTSSAITAPPPGWPYYSDSDAVPTFIAAPSTSTAPTSSGRVSLNATITKEYLPALNSITGYSRGLKLLATTMTSQEGFSSTTRSYRTNNPGNVGNTDAGGDNNFKTLEDGIKGQLTYLKRVAAGTHSAYPTGKAKKLEPYFSPEIEKNMDSYKLNPYLPGYDFTPYTGTLEQFVKIYATGARGSNTYLTTIMSFFKKNGVTVTPKTTLASIAAITGDEKITA